MSALNNPRYLQKLGIVRNMINQETMGETDRDKIVVDELCNMLKRGACSLPEFKKAC
jgi:hypothetical protein